MFDLILIWTISVEWSIIAILFAYMFVAEWLGHAEEWMKNKELGSRFKR